MELLVKNKTNYNGNFLKLTHSLSEFKLTFCNERTQQHFHYVCTEWYPYLTKKWNKKLQIMEQKCIPYYRKLDKTYHIFQKDSRLEN